MMIGRQIVIGDEWQTTMIIDGRRGDADDEVDVDDVDDDDAHNDDCTVNNCDVNDTDDAHANDVHY